MFFHFFLRISWIFAVEIAICNLHYLHIDLQWPKWIIDVCSIAEPQSALWSLAAVHLQILEAATTLQFLLEAFPCRWVFLLGRSLGALKLDQCGRQGSWGAQWRNGDGTQGNFRVEIWKEFTLTLPMAKLENADWCSTHFRQWFLGSYCINDWEFWLFESLYFYSVFIRYCPQNWNELKSSTWQKESTAFQLPVKASENSQPERMESQPSMRSGRLTVVPGVSGMMSYITCFSIFSLGFHESLQLK